MKKAKSSTLAWNGYTEFLGELKQRIMSARVSAARAVNNDLVLLYWDIGRGIVEKQQTLGWGESVIETIAKDLQAAFPGVAGFSARNLRSVRQFFIAYSSSEFWLQAVAKLPTIEGSKGRTPIWRPAVAKLENPQELLAEPAVLEFLQRVIAEIPWGQHLLILNKTTDHAARLYYLRATAQFGWSRNVLLNQVKAKAYERAKLEKKTHNFALALPEDLAEQAEEALKSSYNLEFLGIGLIIKERALEDGLIDRLRDFILELGYGFCFVGRQHRLALGQKEFFVDLLFYHRFLKSLVAIDLKLGSFEPEHAGKMDFYLNLLNEKERGPDDQPSIGIILCAEKDELVVEFSLKTKTNPIGVAEYQLMDKLPKEFKGKLPSASELRMALLPDKTVPKKPKRK